MEQVVKEMSKKAYTIRLLHKRNNTTIRVTEKALPAMLDMAQRMIRRGELEAFSVKVGT